MLFGVSGNCDDREVTSLPDELPREPDSEKDTCGGAGAGGGEETRHFKNIYMCFLLNQLAQLVSSWYPNSCPDSPSHPCVIRYGKPGKRCRNNQRNHLFPGNRPSVKKIRDIIAIYWS